MKKLHGLMAMLMALLAFGCSAESPAEEAYGDVTQELACTYPIGGVGRAIVPSLGKITTFGVDAGSVKNMRVIYTPVEGGSPLSGTINWDPASTTSISGSWTGTSLTKIVFDAICGTGVPCMTLNYGLPDQSQILFGNGGTGAPVGSVINMNGGVTRIEATNNATGNYRALKFTGIHNGALVSFTRTIPGTGGC